MILARDGNAATSQGLHRVVAAVVPKGQPVRSFTCRQTDDLVPQANAIEWHLAHERSDRLDYGLCARRIPGPVGDEHTIRQERPNAAALVFDGPAAPWLRGRRRMLPGTQSMTNMRSSGSGPCTAPNQPS